MRLTFLVLTLALLTAPPAFAQDASGAHWTMTRLDLDVYPDFANHTFRVVGSARLRLDGADTSLGPTLQLGHDVAPYSNSQTEFATFDTLSASGSAAVALNQASGTRGLVHADIRYARPKRRGQSIEIRFSTLMVQRSFTAVVTDNVAVASSGTGWYPTPIAAAEAGDPASPEETHDRSVGVTRIHMPSSFYSFSTGAFVSRREGTDTIETWRKDGSRPRGFVVGAYQRAARRAAGINVYVYSLTPAMDADALSQQVSVVMASMTSRYGPFPYHQYAAAEIGNDAVRWWGLADGDYQVLRTSLVEVGGVYDLAHEIAHAWWGNLIETTWPGGYLLSESMAEYNAMIAYGDVFGADAFRRALTLDQPIPGTPPDYTMAHFFEYLAQGRAVAISQAQPSGTNYEIGIVKGSRVLHMLRRQVGDDVFFAVLRDLLRTHAHNDLSLADFRAAFVAAAPDRDLGQFFSQWLDRPGAPAFDTRVDCLDGASGKINRVTFTQVQSGEPYALDLDLVLSNGDGARVETTAHVRARETQIDVPNPTCLAQIQIDPRHDLFIWREGYGNRPS